jgi:hypothetical protein
LFWNQRWLYGWLVGEREGREREREGGRKKNREERGREERGKREGGGQKRKGYQVREYFVDMLYLVIYVNRIHCFEHGFFSLFNSHKTKEVRGE